VAAAEGAHALPARSTLGKRQRAQHLGEAPARIAFLWGGAGARSTLGSREAGEVLANARPRRSSKSARNPSKKASEICNFLMRAWPCSEQFSRNEKTQAKLLQAELFEAVSAAGMQQL